MQRGEDSMTGPKRRKGAERGSGRGEVCIGSTGSEGGVNMEKHDVVFKFHIKLETTISIAMHIINCQG